MSRHSFWSSLTVILLAASLVNAQPFERKIESECDIDGQQKAVKLQGDRLWIYSADRLSLECLDLSGTRLVEIELAETTELPLRDFKPVDFAIDKQGSAYVLGLGRDSGSDKFFTYLLSYDPNGRLTGEHRLQPRVAVARVALIPDGNLALLGLDEDGMALQRRQGASGSSSQIKLVHIFSPNGNRLRSTGTVTTPVDNKGWDRLLASLDHFFVVDTAGRLHFELDQSCLFSLSPDGQTRQFRIPAAERQLRLPVTLAPSRDGLFVVLAEGENEVASEHSERGSFIMSNPTEAVYKLEPNGLVLVRQLKSGTRIIGQTEDGKWVKARFSTGRAVFFIENEL